MSIDIATPNNTHAEIAIAAAAAGKMVMCEKPLGRNAAEAARDGGGGRERPASRTWSGTTTAACPAVTLAKQLIDEGRLGRIFHYRAKFLQDWTISKDLPQGGAGLWRLDVGVAGSGVTGDLLAHCIDTALWLNGGIDQSHRDDRDLRQGAEAQPDRQGRAGRDRRRQPVPRALRQWFARQASRRRATPAATRRFTRSRSTASMPRSSGTCTICIACSISIIATRGSCAAGGRSISQTATILT